MTADEQTIEWLACAENPGYFMHNYCHIYDATARTWVPFRLWRAQRETLRDIVMHHLVVILKARQLGLSWLVIGFALWLMLFYPAATISVFSRRQEEAVYLLGNERLRGMYERLPDWLKARSVTADKDTRWQLSNGSIARAFPTNAGDSYTVTLAIVDEADLAPDLNALMSAAKPTIDGGGRMILLSRSDKSQPQSEFKRIYQAAKAGQSPWKAIFLPWYARPARDNAWYEEQKRDILSRTTALDDLHEQYPATDTEALAPKSLDKRIPAVWLNQCYRELEAIESGPSINGLIVYRAPQAGRSYVIGGDPAEGNPTSDDSTATVLDSESGEEVAKLSGKFQPSTFAGHIATIARWYRNARVLIERNNHGHAVILWLSDHARDIKLLNGYDDRPGWLSNSKGKTLLYDACADGAKDQDYIIHSFVTWSQLCSIEGSTLLAPKGELDDHADSLALAHMARRLRPKQTGLIVQGAAKGWQPGRAK